MNSSKKYSYRILAQDTSKGPVYSIHEVELNALDVPIKYNKLPVSLIHTSLESMIIELEDILNSYEEPILSAESFPDPYI